MSGRMHHHMERRFLFIFFIVIATFQTFAEGPTHCQKDLLKLLSRMSNEENPRVYEVKSFSAQKNRIESPLLKGLDEPRVEAKILKQGVLKMSPVSTEELVATFAETQQKGFWLLFNPSGPQDRVQSGHFTILVGGFLFNRLGDNLGQMSMSSNPIKKLVAGMIQQGGLPYPYMVAQYFEIIQESTQILAEFFHRRVWNYFDSNANQIFKTQYHPLPDTRGRNICNAENCLNFSISFMDEKYLQVMPELAQVRSEVGTMRAAQIPARQPFLNAQTPSYRGTFIVANKAEELESSLVNGTFNDEVTGGQLLIEGPAVRLREDSEVDQVARKTRAIELIKTQLPL